MLTDIKIRSLKPREKSYRVFDGAGMYLEVSPRGGKYWRLKYRFGGKAKTLAMGVYPAVSLAQARAKRGMARIELAGGADPSATRKAKKTADADTLEAVSREWHSKQAPLWSADTGHKNLHRLERDAFPSLGSRPLGEITAQELLVCLRRVEGRGAYNLAHRLRSCLVKIYLYSISTGRSHSNPAADLKWALVPMKKQHFAAITDPIQVGALMRSIDAYSGSFVVKCALKLQAYTFVRPGELRGAQWLELDVDLNRDVMSLHEWRIPAKRMKMGSEHIVPLSVQACDVIRDISTITRSSDYVFHGQRRAGPISENTINCALRAMGYPKDKMTGHGFRAMARTLLDEVLGVRPDIIEHQLAHKVKDPMGRAYNRTTHLAERRRMMQQWADYLDALKNGADVVPIRCIA